VTRQSERNRRARGAESRRHRPILVTGARRSGTGWLGQVLAASPAGVGWIWEPFSILHRPGTCAVEFPYWFPSVTDENGQAYESAVADTLAWRYRPTAELRSLRSPKDVARMARDWYSFSGHRRRGSIPVLKDPIALFSSEWLASRFGMDVAVLIRHPAAFTASVKRLHLRHPFDHFLAQPLLMQDWLEPFAGEIERFAAAEQDIVDQGILLWLILHHAIAGFQERHPEWLFVRLEDLSRNPVPEFRQVFAELDLEFDDGVERLVTGTSASTNPAEASRPDSVRRDSASHMWNWTRTLTSEEVDRVRERTMDLSRRFYSDDDWSGPS